MLIAISRPISNGNICTTVTVLGIGPIKSDRWGRGGFACPGELSVTGWSTDQTRNASGIWLCKISLSYSYCRESGFFFFRLTN